MSHNSFNDEFVNQNNTRILSLFEFQNRYKPEIKSESQTREKPSSKKIDDNAKDFLMAVNLYQFKKSLTEITKLANFAAGTGSRIAKSCEKKNMIKVIQLKNLRGRPKYPILTKKAYQILNIKEKKFYGKGAGSEHVLYQNLIKEHFKNYKPIIEFNKNEKFVDVAIKTDKFLLCIEVAMTSIHEKENIEKDFSIAGADFVVIACKDKKTLNQVKMINNKFPESTRIKTRVYLLSEILTCNPDEFIKELTEKHKSNCRTQQQGKLF